jgi:vacuolar-type H+-ATPase subunit I/STV1
LVDPSVDRVGESDLREQAVARLRRKAEFRTHLMIYVLVNGMIILIWAMLGGGFFWPVFPLAGWGIGLVAHAMETYRRDEVTEEQIEAEMQRLRRG